MPPSEIDLAHVSSLWQERSPTSDRPGGQCGLFDVNNVGVQICEYRDQRALEIAVQNGAEAVSGTMLTLQGLDTGVEAARDALAEESARCA